MENESKKSENISNGVKKLWFKRKQYGWGWYPATWEGWLVTAGSIALVVWNFLRIDMGSHSASDTLMEWLPQTLLVIAVLIFICYRTGEAPRWQWGGKKKES